MPLSLWLTPPPTSLISTHLTTLITHLPTVHPSLHSSPTFPPHITLTSQIPLLHKTDLRALTTLSHHQQQQHPGPAVSVSIKSLSYGTQYTKKIYFRVERSRALLGLAREARIMLNGVGEEEAQRAVEREYEPHVGLLYGDVEMGEEVRSAVEDAVQGEKARELEFGAWEGRGWEGGQLVLVRTEGPVEGWEVVARVDIGA